MHSQKYNQIWQAVGLIPEGKVASYGQLADLAGLPGRARLVGKALREAPAEMALPWQRVLRSNGQLAFAKGTPQAQEQTGRLQEEGVAVLNNRVDLKQFQWQPDLAVLLHGLSF